MYPIPNRLGDEQQLAIEPIAPHSVVIEVRVTELRQLFNAMDASPFRERDLDPDAENFIVGWARESPSTATLALLVALGRAPGLADESAALRDAVHEFFSHRAQASRQRLGQLLRIGRISLLVGLAFLTAALGLGDVVATAMKGQRLGELLREGLVICGWVAMWRPLEIFLYGWWPIRTEARLYDRLSIMPVRIVYNARDDSDAWRRDWPAVTPVQSVVQKTPPHASSRKSGEDPAAGDFMPAERGPIAAATADAIAPERASKARTLRQ